MSAASEGAQGPFLLEARAVEYAYPGGVRALERIDLTLRGGELLVVIGPNGSGKSTLVKVLGGLLQPGAGAVHIDGRPVGELAPRARARRVAIVPQFLPALPDVSVQDFVASGRYAHAQSHGGIAHALLGPTTGARDVPVIQRALAACDVTALAQRSMTELSSGQRQRVLLARAIAQESAVLLVDEPTNALDPEHQIGVFELLAAQIRDPMHSDSAVHSARSSSAPSRAALVVTHDLNLAAQYATRLVLIDAGRVVADGPPERVLTPAVLEPVYGRHLHFGTWPASSGHSRPFVLPRRAP